MLHIFNMQKQKSWVDVMIDEQLNITKAQIENFMIQKLSEKYPNIKYSDLIKIKPNYYKTKKGTIYCWNYILNEWCITNL